MSDVPHSVTRKASEAADPTNVVPAPMATFAACLAAIGVAVGTVGGALALAVVVGLLALVMAWGWPRLLEAPAAKGSSVVLAVGAVGMSTVLAVSPREDGLRWLASALAIGLMIVFLHELVRRDGRPRLTESVGIALFGFAIFASGTFFAEAVEHTGGRAVVDAAVAGVAVGMIVDLVLHRRPATTDWSLPLGMALAGAAGAALTTVSDAPMSAGILAAVLASGLSHALRRLIGPGFETRQQVALGVASVLLVGAVPYAALSIHAL